MMIATNTKLTSTTTNAVCIVFDSTSEMIGLGHHEELFCTLHILRLRASSGASWLSQKKRSHCQQPLGLSIPYLQNNVICIDRQEILSKLDD